VEDKKDPHNCEKVARVSKTSHGGVAVPTRGGHAFQVDQREWDYGARMSRERRAAEPRTSRNSDSPDFTEPDPKWDALTDTGSLKPSDEALDWQRRADAWARQAESDPHQSVEPANRWSDVASTGRTTFPADGVGWRTETAEWRATGARWRQTTEWRSTTGNHVWRSTTEAWQSGDDSSYPSAEETPMSQPALSSTAWSDEASADSRPAWQQFTDPADEPSRQSDAASTPSRQQPAPRTPAESSPSWQQLVEPDRQPSWNSRPSWQRDAIEGSATWTDRTDQRSARTPAPADSGTWLRSDDPVDDGRHLVREDDRAAWRRDSGAGSPPVGRRRAPEPGFAPSGGTGWSGARSEADNWENTDGWARHTDTGGIQLYGDTPAPPSAGSWGTGTGFGSRNVNRRDDDSRRPEPGAYGAAPSYEIPPATPYEPPPRPPRRDDTAGTRALPTGGYDETPRQRYAYEDEQTRNLDEADGGRRRARRYADDPSTPRRSAAPAPSDFPRRGDAPAPGDTGTFPRRGAGPAPSETGSFTRRGALPAPSETGSFAPPGSGFARRGAAPAPGDTGSFAPPEPRGPRRSRSEQSETATFGAAPMSPPPAAPPGGASKGRAKYNGGGGDWRDQTGSWEAEPDTSSWTRDPDTGQWSRSEDDPRILAWRREAERREAMGEGPRALAPPPPAIPEARPEQPAAGWRNAAQPALPPAPAPRSGTPYSAGGYGTAPTNSVASRDPYGQPRGSTPTSAVPGPPSGYGVVPTSSVPGRDPYDQPRGYGSAAPERDPYDQPRGYGSAPTSSLPAREPYEPRGYGSAPTSSVPAREPSEPSGYGSAPTSAVPGRGYPGEPGNAPRSGAAYGGGTVAPYSSQPALPSAPRSAPGYGGSGAPPARDLPGGPIGYSASAPVSAPRSTPGYPGPLSSAPAAAPRTNGAPQYIPIDEPQRSGRRRAEDDDPPTRRGAVDPMAYTEEPPGPDAWLPGSGPRASRPGRASVSDAVPPWSGDDLTEVRPQSEPDSWHLEERRERARGSAVYREGNLGDWRRDLADQSDLAEGESRRFGTADYVPFRSSGSAAVEGISNLSTTSTSLIAPVPREAGQAASAGLATGPDAAPQRASASWNGPSGAYERRPVTGGYPTSRKSDLLDPDDEEDEQGSGGPLAVVGYTVIWYGVPVILFVVYMLVVGTGGQGHALGTLSKAAPQFLISLVLSVLVALGLRLVSQSWKAISVGLAAAVVGGGLATVLTSVITGNSLS